MLSCIYFAAVAGGHLQQAHDDSGEGEISYSQAELPADASGNGMLLYSKTGAYLQLHEEKDADGTSMQYLHIVAGEIENVELCKWILRASDEPEYFYLTPTITPSRVAHVGRMSTAEGAPVTTCALAASDNYKVKLEATSEAGARASAFFRILFKHSEKCLEIGENNYIMQGTQYRSDCSSWAWDTYATDAKLSPNSPAS